MLSPQDEAAVMTLMRWGSLLLALVFALKIVKYLLHLGALNGL